ncbi:malate synthase G [Methylovirgula sp. HY1]|uniref:malate synthase G n=1 Tax=Methylovirgula sp. HY1 TaxID=2822761 RepID=UPI001C5BB2F4|nr:malate synthase G [Methylovirgula sp. HY1]QXX74560.1 Malate synthase G [Methylovirgula sp. HY1]
MLYREIGGLRIAEALYDFVLYEALSGTGIGANLFWTGLERLIDDFGPRIREHLLFRDRLQSDIDAYHLARRQQPFDAQDYAAHLRAIGYCVEAPPECVIRTRNIDEALANQAGPRFIVPASNARYLLNAVNARWGSLYDALYGTDAISEEGGAERGQSYNKVRGARVIARGRDMLHRAVPLEAGSHKSAIGYCVEAQMLRITLEGGEKVGLQRPEQFIGYQGRPAQPTGVLLRANGRHIEIKLDRNHAVGREDRAGIADIILESALITVVDLEDGVVAVDAQDKVGLYRNWLELMKGTLRAQFKKNGRVTDRLIALDRRYIAATGAPLTLPGRGLMLVRISGHHVLTDAVLDAKGEAISEALLDAVMTALIAIHDLKRAKPPRNSLTGAINIIVPKLHGPAEVALANALFLRIEDLLRLPKHSLKMAITDEERRTNFNRAACIQAAADRIIYVDTDLRDRIGDEIHTSMEAGPMVRGNEIAEMLAQRSAPPLAGSNMTWVASPTAATLQVLQDHLGDVAAPAKGSDASAAADRFAIAVSEASFAPEEITQELDHHCHNILAYVVRWIDQGIGCSHMLDIHGIGRMEDRAILRLASQHIANWLHHETVTEAQVKETLERMAILVDQQNQGDPDYRPMAPGFDGQAFHAAVDLVFKGRMQPNGYTEQSLYARRREVKAGQAPNVSNRYEALKGATRGLESGEALLGTAD